MKSPNDLIGPGKMTFKDHHSYTDFSQCQIKHIDFDFVVDFEQKKLIAKAIYSLEKPQSGSLFLDSSDLKISRVYGEDKDVEWELDRDNPVLGQRLHLKNLEAVESFTVEYSTSPGARALQWTDPVQTAGKEHPFLYSQCQAINARSLFPCQDSPSVRITYSASVEVPKGLVAVMGAQPVETVEKESSKVYKFEMPQAIPSYLFAIAVGNLEFAEIGPRTGVYAEPELIEAAAWEYAGNEEMLDAAEGLLGPYLWDRYDLLIMPPSFPFGGMENPRLTFLSPTAILGDRSYLSLINHELAHAWTGNLVTNASWDHFWLNEGWTTYAESRISEAIEGKEKADMLMATYTESARQEIEFFGEGNVLTQLRTDLKGLDPDASVSQIPYYKGAHFLTELEKVVGREKFDAFIQVYMQRYQFKSIGTEEFLVFLEAELPEAVEGVDVQNWVFEPGTPKAGFSTPSAQYDHSMEILRRFLAGKRPSKEDVEGWNRFQKMAVLQGVLGKASVEDCSYLDELFDMQNSQDSSLLTLFYQCCVKAGRREVMPRIEGYLGWVGRELHTREIFRALSEQAWAKEETRRIFDKVKAGYHPVSAGNIEAILSKASI
jgi:aminopeptidase N